MARPARRSVVLGLALAAAAVLLLAPLPKGYTRGWRAELLDLGHVPLFAGLTLAAWGYTRGSPRRAVLIGVAIAGLAEVVQSFVGRTASWSDFLYGSLGSLAAGAAILSWQAHRPSWRAGFAVLSLALVAWPAVESGPVLLDAAEGYADFPTLASFRTGRELRRWELRQATLTRAGRLELLPGPEAYPSATLHPIVGDFTGYRWLCVSFAVEGGPLELVASVRDGPERDGHTTHSQAGGTYPPGEHTLRLDLPALAARAKPDPLDLADVRAVQLFTVRPAEVRVVVLRRIWLER